MRGQSSQLQYQFESLKVQLATIEDHYQITVLHTQDNVESLQVFEKEKQGLVQKHQSLVREIQDMKQAFEEEKRSLQQESRSNEEVEEERLLQSLSQEARLSHQREIEKRQQIHRELSQQIQMLQQKLQGIERELVSIEQKKVSSQQMKEQLLQSRLSLQDLVQRSQVLLDQNSQKLLEEVRTLR